LRYFRKDGHNWRKKNDQKTVKEAHERLKVSNFAYKYLLSNGPFQCWSFIIFSNANLRIKLNIVHNGSLEVLMFFTVTMPMGKRI